MAVKKKFNIMAVKKKFYNDNYLLSEFVKSKKFNIMAVKKFNIMAVKKFNIMAVKKKFILIYCFSLHSN